MSKKKTHDDLLTKISSFKDELNRLFDPYNGTTKPTEAEMSYLLGQIKEWARHVPDRYEAFEAITYENSNEWYLGRLEDMGERIEKSLRPAREYFELASVKRDWIEGPYGLQYRVTGDLPIELEDSYTMTNGNGVAYTIRFGCVKEHDRNG